MKCFYTIVFISIVLVEWVHAAPKSINYQENENDILKPPQGKLFDFQEDENDYFEAPKYFDFQEDENDEFEAPRTDKLFDSDEEEDDYFEALFNDDDAFDYDTYKQKTQKRFEKHCFKENQQGCWKDSNCCEDLECNWGGCAACGSGTCRRKS